MIYAIGIGTNIGDKKRNLEHALCMVQKTVGEILNISSVYETEPWGFESKNWFYNAVFTLNSLLEPQILLNKLLKIEKDMGRIRIVEGYADRCIDLDILLCEGYTFFSEKLILPHPKMHERLFVLLPLYEIMPNWVHPILKKDLKEMISLCRDNSKIKRIENYKLTNLSEILYKTEMHLLSQTKL